MDWEVDFWLTWEFDFWSTWEFDFWLTREVDFWLTWEVDFWQGGDDAPAGDKPPSMFKDGKVDPLPNTYLTESVHKVVLQMSVPTQIPRLNLYINDNKESVDEFVRE